MDHKLKVGLLSLGCVRNLVDSEVALGALLQSGYEYAPQIEKSDIAILNTCGFTEEAKQESINAILELAELKKKNRIKTLVVMGCLSQRYGRELAAEISEADVIVGTDSFTDLPRLLEPFRQQSQEPVLEVRPKPQYLLDRFAPRKTLTPPHLAYLKISEGCINACSYCAIPRMKGRHRSRRIDDIVAEAVERASEGRLREINLIGQDTAAYGYDLEGRFLLADLLKTLAEALPDVWIRPLYAHPAHVTPELIRVFRDYKNICAYVDLPIEHSHPEMLKRMNRGVTRKTMDEVIQAFRGEIPGMVLRTAVIVGFPGETQEEFKDLLDYMKAVRFERLGAFTFSREEGTRAESMDQQIPEAVKKDRYSQVMELQSSITQTWNQSRIGQELKVLVEEKDPQAPVYMGRTEADAPEVDGHVTIHSDKNLPLGEFIKVQIKDALEHDLIGEPV